jgi:hypothetical protein
MRPKKLLLRAAQHLQEAWRAALKVAAHENTYHLEQLGECLEAVQRCRRCLAHTHRRGWAMAQARLRDNLVSLAEELHRASGTALARTEAEPLTAPSLRFLLEELKQIEADFGGLTIDWKDKAVCATTESVALQHVELGPFAIRFYWLRLPRAFDSFCFDVVALEPNPPQVSDDVTHPHVKNNKLCAGDAIGPVKSALKQGRLADAFHLVRGVLFTYNPRNPHVALEEWQGVRCYDCECLISADDIYGCGSCSEDYCGDCVARCHGCGDIRCENCLQRCSRCELQCCCHCLMPVKGTDGGFCPDCRRLCTACNAAFFVEAHGADMGLCPACRPAVPPSVQRF